MTPLPQPSRKEDVLQKLRYAEVQRNDLMNALVESYETNELPKFVSMKAEGILSNTRECFDYLAHDLIEGYLIPNASAKFASNYKNGKLKTYFPYFIGQLTQPQWPWDKFKTVDKSVFDKLTGFVNAMEKSLVLEHTSLNARDFRVVQQMVNEKKHSKVIQYEAVPSGAMFHKGPVGTVVLDKATAATPGLKVGSAFGGDNPKPVPAFRLTANGRDVPDLCLFAVVGTQIVMDWSYETFFQSMWQRIYANGPMVVDGIPVERAKWSYVT